MPEPLYDVPLAIIRGVLGSLRTRRSVAGAENLPASGGAVLAMTHFGYLEFAFVGLAVRDQVRRRIRFLVIKTAFRNPIVGWVLRRTRQISVDKSAGADAYAHAIDALRHDELVGVFPEGGVSIAFTVRHVKSGAVRLAAAAGVPLIPVAVWGGHRLATRGRTIRMRDRFRIPVSLVVGTPLPLTGNVDADTKSLHDTLQHLVGTLQDSYPDAGTGRWWQPADRGGTAPAQDDESVGGRIFRE